MFLFGRNSSSVIFSAVAALGIHFASTAAFAQELSKESNAVNSQKVNYTCKDWVFLGNPDNLGKKIYAPEDTMGEIYELDGKKFKTISFYQELTEFSCKDDLVTIVQSYVPSNLNFQTGIIETDGAYNKFLIYPKDRNSEDMLSIEFQKSSSLEGPFKTYGTWYIKKIDDSKWFARTLWKIPGDEAKLGCEGVHKKYPDIVACEYKYKEEYLHPTGDTYKYSDRVLVFKITKKDLTTEILKLPDFL